jgi:hypothetical protein
MNDKQQFEREYMGTFEPSRVPPPPLRPRLAAVLAALTDDDPEWWVWQVKHTEQWDFYTRAVVTHGAALARERRDGALFWHHENDSRGLARHARLLADGVPKDAPERVAVEAELHALLGTQPRELTAEQKAAAKAAVDELLGTE